MPSIKKNIIYSTLYQILTMITPLITAPYISRVLGADGVGIYSYTASIQTYFTMFAALGVLGYGSREISRNRNDDEVRSRLFWEIELMVTVTTLLAIIVWSGVIAVYSKYRIYFTVLSINLFAVVFDISWFFTGLEEFKYIVIKNTVVKLITIMLLFVFIREKSDLLLYIGLMAAGTFAGNLSMWTKIPKFVTTVPFRSLKIKHHIKESFIYFIPTIATSVYTILDKTLIGLITNDSYQNGYYEQATKIINMSKSVAFVALNSVMGARASYLFAKDKLQEVREKLLSAINYILIMGIGMGFGLAGISAGFVPWFFGEGYDSVIWLLRIFSPIIVIIGVSNCLGSLYYTPIGKRALSAKFIIIGSITNLVFNLVFIPKMGAYGAALGSLLAETIITILYILFSENYITLIMIIQLSWKRIVAGVVMLSVILILERGFSGSVFLTISQIVCGIAVYGCVLILLKDRYLEEILKRVWNKHIR